MLSASLECYDARASAHYTINRLWAVSNFFIPCQEDDWHELLTTEHPDLIKRASVFE